MSDLARDIQSHIADFRSAKQQALAFVPSIPDELFLQKPSEDVWSAAECYDHLVHVGNMYLERIRDAYARETDQKAEEPFHHRWLMKKIIQFLEPPYSMKMGTPKSFDPEPVSELDKDEVLQEFIILQDTFIDLLQQHPSKPLDQITIHSPAYKFVRMNISEALAFTAAHQRRHMWQAEQILNHVEMAT